MCIFYLYWGKKMTKDLKSCRWTEWRKSLTSSDVESFSPGVRAGSERSRCCVRGSEGSFSGLFPSSLSPGWRRPKACRPHSQPRLPDPAVPSESCWGRCGTSALSADQPGCSQGWRSAGGSSAERWWPTEENKRRGYREVVRVSPGGWMRATVCLPKESKHLREKKTRFSPYGL